MALAVHLLSCLLGTGSWVAINGLWVELPLIVPEAPEGWDLPAHLTLLIQLANAGPLAVALLHRLRPQWLHEPGLIGGLAGLGALACLLLAFLWRARVVVGGSPRSLALLVLLFCLALVDCTSSVTFLPYMRRFPAPFLTSYFVGEGLSGLLPGLVALGQGAGAVRCVNGTQPEYLPPRFSVTLFFLFLAAMMGLCLAALIGLQQLPAARRERAKEQSQARAPVEERPMMGSVPSAGRLSWARAAAVFGLLGWANALSNAVLPAVQSYSCLPYGRAAYHLAATLAALANPLACFVGMALPSRSLLALGLLTAVGSGCGCYIMAMAVLSPCPPLLHSAAGATFIVLSWVLCVGLLSYVKLMIGLMLRDEGHGALVWCGAVVQLGSMLGALTMFPLVSVYRLFHAGDPCSTRCPA
ncbi:riboflavin transporter 2 isoform X2 [Alligator mississippiensis]|nr:riboflavin transporter 2 isoform X2 [Alligator mississippiensis]